MKKIHEIKKNIVQKMELAPETVGCTRLTVIDNTHVYLENYKGVVEYTQKRIGIDIGACMLLISGDGLELLSFGRDSVAVKGSIASIQYDNFT